MSAEETEDKVRILFVDDEKSVLNALRRSMRKEGYKIHLTTDVEDALRIIGNEHIDIVVSDHLMPAMTGIEFLAMASRLHLRVVRIMLTGQADVDMAIRAINEGQVNRFLTKPWDDVQLKFVLRDAAREVLLQRKLLAAEIENNKSEEEKFPSIKRDGSGAIVLDLH
jgi:DNA-binding NtrC family response regulator